MTNRTVLRYHGGKHLMAPWIVSHFPAHRCYVEPYAGGASVLMNKTQAKAEVYNDLDSDVVNLFRVLRDQGAALQEKLELTPFARAEFDLAYEVSAEPVERARRTLIRAGLGRATASVSSPWKASFRNYSGAGRSTTAAQDWANYPSYIGEFRNRLKGVIIENSDARKLIKVNDSVDTLFYVDPPYVSSSRDPSSDYRHEMTDEQHVGLIDQMKGSIGKFVISGYRSALYDDCLRDWRREEFETHADGASKRTECIWLSPNIPREGLFAGRF